MSTRSGGIRCQSLTREPPAKRTLPPRSVPLWFTWLHGHSKPHAPELNPVEYIWPYWKQHELPNVCPKDYGELSRRARQALRRMRRKPRLITAFWKQSSLCFD